VLPYIHTVVKMPDYKPIPTLEEIEDMDKQRSKAIESIH
jgi:hypothetical protein